LANKKKGVISAKLANKSGVNRSTTTRQLSKIKLKHRVRQIVPKYSPEVEKIESKVGKPLYNSDPLIAMDDEKYFTYSIKQNARKYWF
jgi:hypothetical protein